MRSWMVVGGLLLVGCAQDEINPFDTNSTSVTADAGGLDATTAAADTGDSEGGGSTETGDGDGDGTESGDGDGCDPQASMQCVGSEIFWFDCEGVQGEWVEECSTEEFCVTDTCVSPDYNGQWLVTANPDTKTFLCGNATFAPVLYDVSIEGDVASAITQNFTPQIMLSGSRVGKAVNMTGMFTDAQGGSHAIIENWLFYSPTEFSGTSNETVMIGGINCGNLIWNITGIKQ